MTIDNKTQRRRVLITIVYKWYLICWQYLFFGNQCNSTSLVSKTANSPKLIKKINKGDTQNLSCFDRINVTTIIYCINNVLSFCLKNGTLIHLISPLRQDYDTRLFLMWSAHTLTSKDKNYLLPLS